MKYRITFTVREVIEQDLTCEVDISNMDELADTILEISNGEFLSFEIIDENPEHREVQGVIISEINKVE